VATVTGTNNSETLNRASGVTDGADTIFGLGGDDTIYGLGGEDIIAGGDGADTIDGGDGIDTVEYSDSSIGVTVSLAAGVGLGGTAEGDVLINIESITGSSFADFLIGDGGANTLNGGEGNDLLRGGEGADILIGGEGRDQADYSDSLTGVSVNLSTGTGTGGTAEGDQLVGIEVLSGSVFDDFLVGDNLDNGLFGGVGDDVLDGQGGNDRIFGGAGRDSLKGGGGSDRLEGQFGNDTLIGGAGADILLGGEGADTFFWTSLGETGTNGATADVVADFNRTEGDLLDLSAIDADVTGSGNQSFTFIGTAEFTAPGQIRYFIDGNHTYIVLNTDADVFREAIIDVSGVHTVSASWFDL
jgi:Ca2+-binding RTX toxin-like protein